MSHKQVSMVMAVALLLSGVKLDAAGQQLITYGKQYGVSFGFGGAVGYALGKSEGFKEGAATVKPAPLSLGTTQAAACENGHLVQAAVMPLGVEQVSALAVLSAAMLPDDFLAKEEASGGLTPKSRTRALAIKKAAKGDEKKGGMIDEKNIVSNAGVQAARRNIGKILGLIPTEEAGHAVRAAVDKGLIINAAKEGVQQALDVDSLSSAIAAKVKGAEGKEQKLTQTSAQKLLTELSLDEYKELRKASNPVGQQLRALAALVVD